MSELQELTERIRLIEQVLGFDRDNDETLRLYGSGFTRTQAKIVALLMAREFVSTKAIYATLYGNRPDCDQPQVHTVRVLISKLRKKLEGHGVDLKTNWGRGWFLDSAGRERIAAL